ncbi:SDR family oxidoreductase [Sodalis sp. dw_96]|uniref:SDR family oxidoreductase n=1 Tax=Sodalis sp. dw_96 TaxID=2719794 RepID=UPI001BD40C93|nr:SDR family oxidoreductase [Sodalis sp. dw_96]
MSQTLQGKIALVTGGSTGIGLGIAQEFVNEGAFVFITARRKQQLDDALAQLGNQAAGIQADVADLAALDTLFDQIKSQKGHLDIVVANAGGGEFAPLGAITEEHYDRTFDINVKGVLFTVQKSLPLLSKGASVILTGSTTSALGGKDFSVYSATKAAVRNFARSWIQDLAGQDIRINVLSPGPVQTPGLLGLVEQEHQQGLLQTMASLVPLGRVGQPAEIGKVAVFLASDAASFVNGAELFVDGGQAQI